MECLSLNDISIMTNAVLEGADCICYGINTDTRFLKEGELFVALKGPSFNGHDFILEAERLKACGVMIDQPLTVKTKLPILHVSNTQLALGKLAKHYRQHFDLSIAVVTGSSGKTTVKEMTALILSQENTILANPGNFNNEIGLPLTMLTLDKSHTFGIFELGARRKGDIAYLADLALPKVAAITNIGTAHLEMFKSREEIAKTKGEIYQSLPCDGIAIWNAQDEFVPYWKNLLTAQRIITYGSDMQSTISYEKLQLHPSYSIFDLVTDIGTVSIHLPVPGVHNVLNALTAVAIARAFNISLGMIAKGLNSFSNIKGRLQIKKGVQGACIIDDTYNANPQSVMAALHVLATYPGKKIFIMGDMLELGSESSLLHQAVGEKAAALEIDEMLTVGALTPDALTGFKKGRHFDNKETLISALVPLLNKEVTVLIKGSRSMRLEDIVLAITEK